MTMSLQILRRFPVSIALTLAWVIFLQWIAYGAEPKKVIDSDRSKFLSEIVDVNLSAFVPMPQIQLNPVYSKLEDLPKDLQLDPDKGIVSDLFAVHDKLGPDQAYIKADRVIKRIKNPNLAEWARFAKADFLFEAQSKRTDPKYSIAIDEYQDIIRRFPLDSQIPRVLYQIALGQLKISFFSDVESTTNRAIKDFGQSEFAPLYHLVLAESAFLSRDDIKASIEFNYIIQQYPRSRPAVDAAFRKAFILFRKGDFKAAMQTYQDLEKFHSAEIQNLKLETSADSTDKLIDRVFYAETVFLNGRYVEAAKLFQDLANLFPTQPVAPFVFLRLGDTYFKRGEPRPALELYSYVLDHYANDPIAKAVARIKKADLFFLTDDIRGARSNEKLLQEAFEDARAGGNSTVAALALIKLAAHHLAFHIYPKAQEVLAQYLDLYSDSVNQKWAHAQYVKTIEVEIVDYYNREDYLAALTTYLVHDRQQLQGFNDTRVLIKISDAAKRLSLYEKASEILNRVVYLEKTSEGRQEALLKLVDILIIEGQLKSAAERLRRFNFAYPTTPLNHLYEMYWGMLYTALKNPDQAIEHYERALDAANGRPAAIFEIRNVYIKLAGEYEKVALSVKAIECYEKYIDLVTDAKKSPLSTTSDQLTAKDDFLVKTSRYHIADLYFSMRDYVRAVEAYREVAAEIKDEPFLSDAKYRIGECYLELGDRQAALKAFQSLKSSDPNNLWAKAADSYIKTVEMEVKYGIRILN